MKFRFVLLDPSGISPAPLLILIRRNRFRIDCHPFVESTIARIYGNDMENRIRIASIVKISNFSKERIDRIETKFFKSRLGKVELSFIGLRRVAKIWLFFLKIEREHGNLERRRSVKIPKTKNYFRWNHVRTTMPQKSPSFPFPASVNLDSSTSHPSK